MLGIYKKNGYENFSDYITDLYFGAKDDEMDKTLFNWDDDHYDSETGVWTGKMIWKEKEADLLTLSRVDETIIQKVLGDLYVFKNEEEFKKVEKEAYKFLDHAIDLRLFWTPYLAKYNTDQDFLTYVINDELREKLELELYKLFLLNDVNYTGDKTFLYYVKKHGIKARYRFKAWKIYKSIKQYKKEFIYE